MTIKSLEQYRQLKNEVAQLTQRLERLQNNDSAYVFDTVKGSSHTMPYQERVITIVGISEKHVATHSKLTRLLKDRVSRLQDSLLAIEKFIDNVERTDIRQIIEHRYIQGLSWKVTARKVYGYPSEDRARKAVTRFFAEI